MKHNQIKREYLELVQLGLLPLWCLSGLLLLLPSLGFYGEIIRFDL